MPSRNRTYPFSPTHLGQVEIGDFWAVQLPDGSYGSLQVTDLRRSGVASRSSLIVSVVDWSGPEPPRREQIEGQRLLVQGLTGVEAFTQGGATILGNVQPTGTALVGDNNFRDDFVGAQHYVFGWKTLSQVAANALANPGGTP